jgi:hypothetical protein
MILVQSWSCGTKRDLTTAIRSSGQSDARVQFTVHRKHRVTSKSGSFHVESPGLTPHHLIATQRCEDPSSVAGTTWVNFNAWSRLTSLSEVTVDRLLRGKNDLVGDRR